MYGQSGFTVDINFFTAKNVDTIEMCMFSEESSRKTTYYFGFAQTVYNDHIQIAVGRTGIGTEFESTAFVFLIHDGSKIYFGKLFFFIVIHEQCHRRWLQEKQLFQCDKEIDQFAEADFVQDFFHRSDANFMAYRCVKTDSTADRETTAAGTTGNMRNVHQMWTFIGKNQFKCLHRILWKFHTAAEIVSGSGGNVAENDTGNIFYSAQDFLYRTITANGNQLDLTIFRNRGSNGSRKLNSMSFIFCKKSLVFNIPFTQNVLQIPPDQSTFAGTGVGISLKLYMSF